MNHLQNTDTVTIAETLGKTISLILAWPFDIAHSMYALAVRAGFFKNSMLASARFSRHISALEKTLLGRWARQV